jgi:hypothetical protein
MLRGASAKGNPGDQETGDNEENIDTHKAAWQR